MDFKHIEDLDHTLENLVAGSQIQRANTSKVIDTNDNGELIDINNTPVYKEDYELWKSIGH